MERRRFVKQTGLLSIIGLSQLHCKFKDLDNNTAIGIQLYTVRAAMKKNPIGTLKILKEIGYSSVEHAGYKEGKYYGIAPLEFKKILDDLELSMPSGHTQTGLNVPDQVGTMTNNFDQVCEHAASIGQEAIINGWYQQSRFSTIDEVKKLIDLYNKCGATAKKHGVVFAHHNHDFEFKELEGTSTYELMLKESSEDVKFELDLYWIKKAGKDPLAYFDKYPGKFPYWHVKDMDDTPEQFFTEVGKGVIDWAPIFAQKETAGMQHFFVEQDVCKNHKPLESVKISFDYLEQKKAQYF